MAEVPETGRRVELPPGAEGDFAVYLNGREVREGDDFERTADALVFHEPLQISRKTGLLGRIQMTTVGIGVYDRIDSVDVHASLPNGEVRTFADLHAIPGS
jgi:hypothetical protein